MGNDKLRHTLRTRQLAFDTVLISAGVAGFLFLLYQLQPFLNPIYLVLSIWLLIWPLRRYRAARALLMTSSLLLLLWLFDELSAIVLPFLATYLLAFLFNPAVTWATERLRLPRWVAASAMTLLTVGLIALVIGLILPAVVDQLQLLARDIIRSMTNFRGWIRENPLLAYLESIQVLDRQSLENELASFIPRQISLLAQNIPRAIQSLYLSIGSVIGAITMAVILPVVLYYLLRDYPVVQQRLVDFLPPFKGSREYAVIIGRIMGNYLRGQVTISTIAAINVSFWLTLFDVPFALLIGLLAGLLNMIPNIGAIITNLLGILLALLFGDPPLVKALIVFLVLLGEQLLEASVLTPRIMSHRVGLHPVLIILSLFVFGRFFGVLGLLLAVPTTALLITFYQTIRGELTLDYEEPQPQDLSTPEEVE